jgi:repressor LexA
VSTGFLENGELPVDIGERLLEAFKTSGIQDKKVIAERLGFKSSKAVYKVINGTQELSFDSLRRFRESTAYSIDWLLTGESPEGRTASAGFLADAEEEAVRELAAEAGEQYDLTLRKLIRDRLRSIGRLPPEAEPLHVDYYGAEWTDVPLLGQVAAGSPIEVFEFKETARVIKTWPESKKVYALRVTGDSMEDAGIQDGDLIVCLEAAEARRGQLVVALIDGDQATIKRFYRENGTVILKPENPAHEAQRYEANRVRIQGRVESIIRAAKDTS